MSDHELQQEVERLHQELDVVTRSRDRLREMIAAILPLDRKQTEKEVMKMMQEPILGIEDIIEDLQNGASGKGHQIRA